MSYETPTLLHVGAVPEVVLAKEVRLNFDDSTGSEPSSVIVSILDVD